MRLIAGPPGSGKTAAILSELRDALKAGDGRGVRLLVPTATLALHTQNELAREGFVFSRSVVQTLNGFVAEWLADTPQVPETLFRWLVEDAARRLNRAEFAQVAEFPGFSASLARTIEEFSSAGCDSARLAAHLPEAPLAEAFLAIYREVDRELAQRGMALRGRRLEIAAARIAAQGTGDVRTVWFDGFHALPEPELRVIAALAKACQRHDYARAILRGRKHGPAWESGLSGRNVAAAAHTQPAMTLVKAPNIERECEEIARRILAQAADGRAFREMGVIVRSAEAYVPVLRSTFARFGIPARFYFDANLEEHAAMRFLSGAMDAMLGGWDHAATLAALRLAPRFADSNAMDRFDFAVREQIPNAGLGSAARHSAGECRPAAAADHADLRALEEWRGLGSDAARVDIAIEHAAQSVPASRARRSMRITNWHCSIAARPRRWMLLTSAVAEAAMASRRQQGASGACPTSGAR